METVLVYGATHGKLDVEHRYLDYKRARKYMHDHGFYFLCDNLEPDVEYFLDIENFELSLNYAASLWRNYPRGYEPRIQIYRIPKKDFYVFDLDGETYHVINAYQMATISRESDGLYSGYFLTDSDPHVNAKRVLLAINERKARVAAAGF